MAQPVEEPIDRLCPSDRGPVEDRSRNAKKFLSPSGLFFPVKVILFPVEDRSRSG